MEKEQNKLLEEASNTSGESEVGVLGISRSKVSPKIDEIRKGSSRRKLIKP
jgi:biotin operon repressor